MRLFLLVFQRQLGYLQCELITIINPSNYVVRTFGSLFFCVTEMLYGQVISSFSLCVGRVNYFMNCSHWYVMLCANHPQASVNDFILYLKNLCSVSAAFDTTI